MIGVLASSLGFLLCGVSVGCCVLLLALWLRGE